MPAFDRRKLLISATGLAGGLLAGSAVSAAMLRKDREPALTLLGSGQSLSVLIGSNRARIAILHGSDPADFGNALRQARMPLLDRTDLAIVPAPESTGQTFLRSALAQLGQSSVFAVGDATPLLDAGIKVDETLTAATSITLPGGITVTLSERTDEWWHASVETEDQTFALALGESDEISTTDRLTAWIHLDNALPAADQLGGSKPALIVIPAAAMSGSAAREYRESAGWSPEIVRVHAGDSKRLPLD